MATLLLSPLRYKTFSNLTTGASAENDDFANLQ